MTLALRGNWNYPTTVWAGPGRIAELAQRCADFVEKHARPVVAERRQEASHAAD